MPTTRRRRRRTRKPSLSPTARAWLWSQLLPAAFDQQEYYRLRYHDWYAKPLWQRYRAQVLADWLESSPGKRPHLWWEHDAPRQKAVMQGKELPIEVAVPRKRLGGTGTPAFEVLAFQPSYRFGIPAIWLWKSIIDYFQRTGGGRMGDTIDLGDPPLFESEAQYLEFHGLFFPGEKQRLLEDDWLPEPLSRRHLLACSPVQQTDAIAIDRPDVESAR